SVQRNSPDLFQSARYVEAVLHGRSRRYNENIETRIFSEPLACWRESEYRSHYFSYTCSSDHSNRYDARAWRRIQEISSARIGSKDGFPRSHQQIRSEHSQQFGTVARIIHSLLKQTGDGLRNRLI